MAVTTVPVIVVPVIRNGIVLPISVLSIVPGVPVVEYIATSLNVLFLLLLTDPVKTALVPSLPFSNILLVPSEAKTSPISLPVTPVVVFTVPVNIALVPSVPFSNIFVTPSAA